MEEETTVTSLAEETAKEDTTGVTSADAGQKEDKSGTEKRMSWSEIMADPEYRAEYDRQVQELIRRRLKGREDAEAKLNRLAPVLSAVSDRYFTDGTDWDGADMEELGRAVSCGMTSSQLAKRRADALARYGELVAQSASMGEKYPEFSLEEAMADPRFVTLTAPGSGLTVEDAYFALHRRELQSRTARESLEKASRAVQSGAKRPRENRGTVSGSGVDHDPSTMTKAERAALKRRIYSAAAQGRKINYGD